MQTLAWTYIFTNERHTTLYIGATTNIRTRAWEHKTKRRRKAFSARYNLVKLVYYEAFPDVASAFARERFMKGKSRGWKIALIEKMNPRWDDLSAVFD
jgi:putative endonuclease